MIDHERLIIFKTEKTYLLPSQNSVPDKHAAGENVEEAPTIIGKNLKTMENHEMVEAIVRREKFLKTV